MAARWWKAHGRTFALTTVGTTMSVLALGWLTGAREVMYGALLACLVVAALPVMLVAAGVAVIGLVGLGCAVVAAVGGDAPDVDGATDVGAGLIENGVRIAPRYYAFLGRRRHPALWGGALGVLLGGLALWGVLAATVLPGETRTTEALERARARIELHYAEHGALPRPDGEHHLVLDGAIVEDGFGRPLDYHVLGGSRLAAWRLRSYGYDGSLGGDDLCLAGGTPVIEKLEAAAQLLQLDRRSASLGEQLERLNTLRCER